MQVIVVEREHWDVAKDGVVAMAEDLHELRPIGVFQERSDEIGTEL